MNNNGSSFSGDEEVDDTFTTVSLVCIGELRNELQYFLLLAFVCLDSDSEPGRCALPFL